MNNHPTDKIEILGLSESACSELRDNNIDTVQDLMLLILSKLSSEKGHDNENTPIISMKDAILSVLKDHPNEVFDCADISRELQAKYGNRVSHNINSINSLASVMVRKGLLQRASTGKYYFYSKDTLNNVSLKTAILEVLKTINGTFDSRDIRDKLRERYGNKVSTKMNSIKPQLSALLTEGIIRRTETGAYIYAPTNINMAQLNSFLQANIGKEIEFRYKGKRSNSVNRWRREILWAHDGAYFYISRQYSSGHHISFLKERIIEYRKAD